MEDHAYFDEERLKRILEAQNADSLLCTSKDKVKMKGFKLNISEMKLKLRIKDETFLKIEEYVLNYK